MAPPRVWGPMPPSVGRHVPHALGIATAFGLAGLLLAGDPGKPPAPTTTATPTPTATATPIRTPTSEDRAPSSGHRDPIPRGEGPFVCDREASHHVSQRLRPEPGACEADGSCVSITDGFSNLDLDQLCPTELPVSPQPTHAELAPLRLAGEEIRCRRQLSFFACSVTCFHETRGRTHEALRETYAEHVQWVRDRYGAESDASRQGVPSYPREQHRWSIGATTLSIDLHTSVCLDSADTPASYRTHYTRTRSR